MLKKLIVAALLLPSFTFAASPSCLQPGQPADKSMLNVMQEQWGIEQSDIAADKTKIELLDSQPVSKEYAEYLVHKIPTHPKLNTHKDMLKTYTGDNPVNQIIKYTYYNAKGEQNVLIASNIANDKQCSVLFSDYIVVKREF